MIMYDGIRSINKDTSVIKFTNSRGSSVEVPVTKAVGELIALHLNRIAKDSAVPEKDE